jgi:N-acetylglucosaminyl-diphospho-decaprenol L-rhamnosyltransferase
MPSPRISVVSVLFNSGRVVGEMARAVPADAELVVVDNASCDDGIAVVRSVRPDALVLRASRNGGFARASNAGARAASGEVLVFLNPDAQPEPGALELLADRVRAEPRSIFGPALLAPDGRVRHNLRRRSHPMHEALDWLPAADRWVPQAWWRNLPPGDPRYVRGGEAEYLQGACLAVARRRFEEIGGFDEDFFLYSEEETLCVAVRRAGGRCVYVAEARLTHAGATSTSQVLRTAQRHFGRSRAIFYRKRYGPAGGLAASALIAAAVLVNLATRPLARALGRAKDGARRGHLDMLAGLGRGSVARTRAGHRP